VSCELGVSRGVFTKVQVQRMTNGFLGTQLAVPTVKITLGTPFQAFPLETTPERTPP